MSTETPRLQGNPFKHIIDSKVGTVTTINGKDYLYFAGTGYFQLQSHPGMIRAAVDATTKFGIGCATSRTITGTTQLLLKLEKRIAAFFGTEDADGLFDHLSKAIGAGSGSSAVLYSVVTSIMVAMILYRSQKIMKMKEMVEMTLKGISELMPLALLMLLAFSISDVSNKLGTGIYVATQTKAWLTPQLLPFIIFVISAFIAFSTGTSWGTFAIMMAISVPMARAQGADLYLVVAATIGGGVFGDHCSPISDTTIISSMASASDHMDHVNTQLPYALFIGGITAVLYLILGYVMH